ncbi:hypothetical protein GJ496_010296 [Pomphorhynchus laevis]|nr:hypothetical protein GJ496_010296 [Pomphorhynchus laevis]
MGIDIDHRYERRARRKNPRSRNIYLSMLAKLYRLLSKKTTSKFNQIVYRRLCQSRNNRPPLSLSRLIKLYKAANKTERKQAGDAAVPAMDKEITKVAVCVGTITDDKRIFFVPKVRVCALRVTASARARILKAGGQVLTFDQLAQEYPKGGKDCLLLQGPVKARKVYKHFGLAPGQKYSKTKPYSISHGPKFDRNWRKRRVHHLKK